MAWRGELGDQYTEAHRAPSMRERIEFWSRVLRTIEPGNLPDILEVGSGLCANLVALSRLTGATLFGVEPNESARMKPCGEVAHVFDGTAQSIPLHDGDFSLVFTCGVLIHIPPEELDAACAEIHRVSERYIVCAEYFAAEPETRRYRGRDDLLFKRDFGSHWLNLYPDLNVLDYGFAWKRMTGMDDITWWLFEKR